MPDPYRFTEPAGPAGPGAGPAGPGGGPVRPVLWSLLLVSAAGGSVASSAGLDPLVGAGFGAAALGCAAALIVHHRLRHRR
ncbi:hypothetical protein CUT44_25790 [Streptomyces carminius]|uniref:Uncharacterized protein n=1 Tax=Streptomyces carminius TaxID=2665496 RepID=A0A2M8LSY2_9ACTN|nr:hypothetical protein [Streptomyces carminius]PJE95065.1 hypothetical protein CUT44_25790 [Streptomyces carminius]